MMIGIGLGLTFPRGSLGAFFSASPSQATAYTTDLEDTIISSLSARFSTFQTSAIAYTTDLEDTEIITLGA